MESTSNLFQSSRRLEGKVALITGGARSIGACTAKLFCKHGAKVVIADIRDSLGNALCGDLGPEVSTYVHCDVTIESDIENAVNIAIANNGKLDIMINNAVAIDEGKPSILDNTLSDFQHVLNVNLMGPFLGTKHAARVMIPVRKGSIINLGSVCSVVGGVATHAYTSSKHGLVGLTKNVAAELGQFGIRVNGLSCYFVANVGAKEFFKRELEERNGGVYSNLKGVELREEDVAEAAVYLASDEAKYVSGHNLMVDGGFSVINPSFGLFARSE